MLNQVARGRHAGDNARPHAVSEGCLQEGANRRWPGVSQLDQEPAPAADERTEQSRDGDEQNDRGGGATLGYHDTLLKEVSDAIAAFQADLEAHGLCDRVLTLTISEFGRTAYINGDRGTDHGFSSVAFAIGDAVNGGVHRYAETHGQTS